MVNINDWISLINVLGFLAFIGSVILFRWREGASQAGIDTIRLLQAKDKEQQDLIDGQMSKIHNLTIQVEQMKVELNEKNKQIDGLVKIFQGRDDETVKRSVETNGLVKTHSDYLVKIERNIERLFQTIKLQIKNGNAGN